MWAVWFVFVCPWWVGICGKKKCPKSWAKWYKWYKNLDHQHESHRTNTNIFGRPAEPIFVSFFIIFVRCMAALKHHGFMTGLLEIKQRGNVNWSPNKNLTFLWPKCQIKHRRGQISSLFERGRDHPSVFTLIIVFATTIGATIWTHTFVFFRIYTSYMIIFWAWTLPDRILLNSY